MRSSLLTLLVTLFGLISSKQVASSPSVDTPVITPQRYQIFMSPILARDVFLLDTHSGKIWKQYDSGEEEFGMVWREESIVDDSGDVKGSITFRDYKEIKDKIKERRKKSKTNAK